MERLSEKWGGTDSNENFYSSVLIPTLTKQSSCAGLVNGTLAGIKSKANTVQVQLSAAKMAFRVSTPPPSTLPPPAMDEAALKTLNPGHDLPSFGF